MRRVMLLALIASLVVMNGVACAYELGPDSSWAEIRSTPGILVQAPMIFFGAHAISVVEVCRSGDKLRSRTSEGMTVEAPLGSTRQSYNIDVDLIVSDMRRTRVVYLFTKRFEIPTCGEATE
jgi:hypothetical protein